MSKLDIAEAKTILKAIVAASKKDSELKALLSELVKLASEDNAQRTTRTKVEVHINPISIAAAEGIERLVEELEKLDVAQLIAVIKKYGLDKTRKSYTWKTKERLVSLIKEKVGASSTRGDVFSGNDKSA